MNIIEKDRQYLWHPYTQHKTASTPIAIVKGKGALLWDEIHRRYRFLVGQSLWAF